MNALNLEDHPHKRYNILTGDWILVSPHRTKRPWQGKVEDLPADNRPSYDPSCYLCPGNERAGGAKNPVYTDTFVFTNDFGALLSDTPEGKMENGLLRAEGEAGICRVLCFSPDHSLTLPEMSGQSIQKVIELWQDQYKELGEKSLIKHVQIFENKGQIMGCSNPHPHGQIWAQSSIPQEVAKKCIKQKEYFDQHGRSLLGDYLKQEMEARDRIVLENDHFLALVPFWAVWPYEAMIAPKRPMQHILQLTEAEKVSFASILKGLTIRLDNIFNTSFPYSMGIHQAPTDGKAYPEWHWHMSFYPPLLRSATVKKFMVGYEMFANPQRDITAEMAAAKMREVPAVHYKKG